MAIGNEHLEFMKRETIDVTVLIKCIIISSNSREYYVIASNSIGKILYKYLERINISTKYQFP